MPISWAANSRVRPRRGSAVLNSNASTCSSETLCPLQPWICVGHHGDLQGEVASGNSTLPKITAMTAVPSYRTSERNPKRNRIGPRSDHRNTAQAGRILSKRDVMMVKCAARMGRNWPGTTISARSPIWVRHWRKRNTLKARAQQEVAAGQAMSRGTVRSNCQACGEAYRVKGDRDHHIATLFGRAPVHLPRFRCATCGALDTGIR